MKNDTLRQFVVAASVIMTIVINALANALPFNGKNTGAISDNFKVLFVPAGYVFAIWGVIYIGWIAFAIYQFLPSQRESQRQRRVGYLFALTGVANSVWLFLWHYEQFVLTIIVMISLLSLLIAIYLRLDIGRAKISNVERWCVDIPVSVYLGWITVATIANATSVLDYIKWNGWGIAPDVWTIIMLIATLLIASAMIFTRHDAAFLIVIIWAVIGIAIKQSAVASVATTSWMVAALTALMLGIGMWQSRKTSV